MFKTNLYNHKKTNGFTLIEVLVVSTIIIVLTTIGAVTYSKAGQSSRNAKRKADLETIRQALVMRRTDEGSYYNGDVTISNQAAYSTLGLSDYLSEPYPLDPKSPAQNYSYSGSATTFTLTATLEPDTTLYTLKNP